MRIYTEVNFQWDDKKGKLVEVSSDSFDYQGELALCGKSWKEYDRWDSAGNKYTIRLSGQKYFNQWKTEWMEVQDQSGKVVYSVGKDHWGTDARLANGESYIKLGSGGGWGDTHVTKDPLDGNIYSSYGGFQEGFKNEYGYTPSGDTELNTRWVNELKDLSAGDRSPLIESMREHGGELSDAYWDAGELGLTDQGFLGDNPENPWSQEWYEYEEANNPNWDDVKGTLKESDIPDQDWELIGELEPLETAAYLTKDIIASEMKLWSDITKGDRPDAFQDALEDAVQELGWAEEDIIEAYGTLQEKFTELGEDYTTDVSELTGERIVDPFTGEVISEGTYTEDIRLAGELKEEGLKTTVTTREEELEALREEAGGEIRAAEAKIGAAGFASTGVGRTARDILAEEIGEAAEDIDITFGDERTLVKEAYTEETGILTKEKNVSLGEYKKTRDRDARTAAEGDWKTLTTSYERLLEDYGALKGEEGAYTLPGVSAPGFTTSGGIAAQAETELRGIQSVLQEMITTTRDVEGVSDIWDPTTNLWDPFKDPETALYGLGEQYGWDPISGTFQDQFVSGLFDPTVEQLQYTPTEALRLYDPAEVLPWEEEDDGGGNGVPRITGTR